ncbi:hypothetical protein BCF59_0497 [Mycoplasmopsis mustelae]|uniref:Uncharacterized protein n=1 Tax=Mycoplasmopsis mustelae TaxID=171289 RepID=A0A4R7UC96_9BACT|nr:hypothetical protein [Mycoplasmopsis mustelae]TDV23508.1 hypothetical protein BCF59_0497 [Mycoplasmopsis mustelae]
MATSVVNIKLLLDNKQMQKELDKSVKQFQTAMSGIKSVMKSVNFSSIFSYANSAIDEYMAKMRLAANLTSQGFSEASQQSLFNISDAFEKIGYNADTANDAFTQFITSGKATSLQTLGIYLDSNTKSTLAAADAQQRLNYVLEQGQSMLQAQQDKMPESIKTMIEFRKAGDDARKAIGTAFMNTVSNLINALGGVGPALKAAIAAFTAYKIAMIAGNMGIAIAKTLAMGGLFVWPAVAVLSGLALAQIAAIGAASGIAINSISAGPTPNMPQPDANVTKVYVDVSEDKYGKEVRQRSGNNSGRVA